MITQLIFVVFACPALRIHVSEPTINILQRTDCKFEHEMRGETYLKVRTIIARFTDNTEPNGEAV